MVFGKFQSREEAFIGPLKKNPLSISTSRPDFTEDPSSDPTTHIRQLKRPVTPAPRNVSASSGYIGYYNHTFIVKQIHSGKISRFKQIHTHTHIYLFLK